jgi:hypothetical protein
MRWSEVHHILIVNLDLLDASHRIAESFSTPTLVGVFGHLEAPLFFLTMQVVRTRHHFTDVIIKRHGWLSLGVM